MNSIRLIYSTAFGLELDYLIIFHFQCNGCFPVQAVARPTSGNEKGQFMWDGDVKPYELIVQMASD